MDTTVTQSESGRPVKRRRGGSTNPDDPGCPVKSGIRQETSSVLPVKLTKIKVTFPWYHFWQILTQIQTSSVTEAHLLTNEINQLLHADPALASQAIHLVELYQCLWDCYVMKCANKLRMQEERRLLQNSNAWLVGENEHLRQVCSFQQSLLWKHHQNFCSVHQGILGILQICDRGSCQMSE